MWRLPWSPSICSQLHPWEAEHGSHTLTTQMESSPDVRLNWTDHTLFLIIIPLLVFSIAVKLFCYKVCFYLLLDIKTRETRFR